MIEQFPPTPHSTVISNPLFVLLARAIVLLSNMGTVLVLTRYLGSEDFGRYVDIQSYALVLMMLAMGGLFVVLTREIARQPEKASVYLGSAIRLQTALLLSVFGAGLVLIPLISQDAVVVEGVRVVSLAYLALIPANLLSTVFVAAQRAAYMTLSSLLERLVYVVVLTIMLLAGLELRQILWAQVASAVAQLLFACWITTRRFVRLPWPAQLPIIRRLFRAAVPLSVSEGCRALDQQLGIILLSSLHSPAAAGLFGAPQRLIFRLVIVPDSILRGLLPFLSRSEVQTRERFGELGGMLIQYMGIAVLTLTATIAPAGQRLALALFGAEYAAASSTVSMLACAAVPLYVGYVLKHLLTVLGKQGYEVLGLTLGLLANGAVAVWAIPRWGAFGAAVAISISQTVFCIVGIAVISSHHPLRIQVKPLLRAMPVLGALALAVWLACQSPWWPLFMTVAWLGAMSMLVGLKVLDPAELRKYLAAGRQEREAT